MLSGMTFKQRPTKTQLATHEAAHEAGHAVIAQHFGFQSITAQTTGLMQSLIWVDPQQPPTHHLDAYLHLAAAGEAAENALLGQPLVAQLQLKQNDFTVDQDVVRYLIARSIGTCIYSAAQAPKNWQALWVVYNTAAFRQDWANTVTSCEALFRVTLRQPLLRTNRFLSSQWSTHRSNPQHPTAPFTIAPATLAPYLI